MSLVTPDILLVLLVLIIFFLEKFFGVVQTKISDIKTYKKVSASKIEKFIIVFIVIVFFGNKIDYVCKIRTTHILEKISSYCSKRSVRIIF